MNNLKKAGAIGGAIVIAACWPLAVGQIGQRILTEGAQHAGNDRVSVQLVKYDRGYLSSEVQTKITLLDPRLKQQFAADGLPTEFLLNSHVSHGIASLSSETKLADSRDFPLTLHTTTQLNGNTDFNLVMNAWNYHRDGEESFTVSVSPSYLKGMVTKLGEVKFESKIPSLAIDFEDDAKIVLTDMSAKGEGKESNGFWIGDQVFSIAKMTGQGNIPEAPAKAGEENVAPVIFQLNGFNYHFTSKLDEQQARFSSQHAFTVDELESKTVHAKQMELDFALNGVDSNAFKQLSNLYQNNPALSNEEIGKALPYVDTLFSQGFDVSLGKMDATIGEGRFTSQVSLSVPKGTEHVTQNPAAVVTALQGHIGTTASTALLKQFPSMHKWADELVVMNMATQNDKGYALKAEIKEGNVVFANGEKIPLVSLVMMGMHGY